MAGLPSNAVVEIEFVSGTWTDVTVDHAADMPTTIHVGRGGIYDSLQPGTFSITLNNEAGAYTPDNPNGAYWPNVVENKRIRFSIVRSATTYRRFLGLIVDWTPTDLNDGTAAVTITATDTIGQLGQRTLDTSWAEQWVYRGQSETVDTFPMDDDVSSTTFRNIGNGVATMEIVNLTSSSGNYQRGTVDQGIMLPGQVTLAPSGSGQGPVLAVDLGRALGTGAVLTFAVKSSQQCDAVNILFVLAAGYDSAGIKLWDLRLGWNAGTSTTDLQVFDVGSNTFLTWYAGIDGDDTWMCVSMYLSGGVSTWWRNNANGFTWGTNTHPDQTRYVVLGGNLTSWQVLGKQSFCPPMSVAGVAASSATLPDGMDKARPLVTVAAVTRLQEVVSHYVGPSVTTTGSINPLVTRPDTTGRTALDVTDQIVQTIGANVYHDYTADTLAVILPDAARSTTSALTVVVSADDDSTQAQLQLQRAVTGKPTRVTVSSPFGSATVVDATAEAGPPKTRREETWSSCASSAPAARAVAGFRLGRSTVARFSQIPVDLVNAANDLWAATMALHPGARITLSSLPSARVGATSRDAYIAGWTEVWTWASARFLFDCTPADAPGEARLDDPIYGRLSAGDGIGTVPGGTAVGVTGNGTLNTALASGPGFTLDGTAYPLDLLWSGERVTVTAVPTATNLLVNGTFDAGITGWAQNTAGTLSWDTTVKRSGAGSLKITATATGWDAAESTALSTVTPGETITWSAWCRVNTNRNVQTIVDYSDIHGTYVSSSAFTTQAGTSGTFVQISATDTVPAGCFGAQVTIVDNATAIGQTMNVDDVVLNGARHQTFTTTARGVAPTVARVHAAGESVDIWMPVAAAAI